MTILIYMIPISLLLSLGFLVAFLWSVENDQMKDLDQKAHSILNDDNERTPS